MLYTVARFPHATMSGVWFCIRFVIAVGESFILHRCLVVERGHVVALVGRDRHTPPVIVMDL